MEKKRAFISLIVMPFLFSCSLSNPDFSFSNNTGCAYIYRNGDVITGQLNEESDYASFGRASNADKVKADMDSGMQVLLYLYQSGCSSCKSMKPIIRQLVKDSKLELAMFDLTSGTQEISRLIAHYPNGNFAQQLSGITTPSLFLLKSPNVIEKIDLSDCKSPTILENKVHPLVNVTNLSRYTSYGGFYNNSGDTGLLFIHFDNDRDSTTFLSTSSFLNLGKCSFKKSGLLEWNSLTPADQTSFEALFPISGDREVVISYSGQSEPTVVSYIENPNQASALIRDYFA